MKKLIGFLSIAALAVTMFTTTSNATESGDITLDSLIGLATANAEDGFDCAYEYVRCDRMYPDRYDMFDWCMWHSGC